MSFEFWDEYISLARKSYLTDRPAGPDPMLNAFYGWFGKIEMAIDKAMSGRFQYFSCHLLDKDRRIALRFHRTDGGRFQRTLLIDDRIQRLGKRIDLGEIVDLKICLQSIVMNNPQSLTRSPLPPGPTFKWFPSKRDYLMPPMRRS